MLNVRTLQNLVLMFPLLLLSACATPCKEGQATTKPHAWVEYSVSLLSPTKVEISIHNPSSKVGACIGDVSWPDTQNAEDVLVVDTAGNRWKYIGPVNIVIGEVKRIRIGPDEFLTTEVDLLPSYFAKPSPDSQLARAYWAGAFFEC